MDEGSFDEGMKDCELVFHTASPFVRSVKNPQKDLVDPAKKGTRNVLETANRIESVKASVKRLLQNDGGAELNNAQQLR